MSESVPDDVSDPNPLAFADAPSHPPVDVAQSYRGVAVAEDPGSENASSPIEACQDLVDHAAPPVYFAELRHMPNDEFLRQYNVNLAQKVAMGSQLRLRFEQEAKLLKKSVAQVARREKRIQDRELEIKNLEWVIGHGLRLAMMKCAESLEMRQAFADVMSAGVVTCIR
nr:hypothetical protein [Tanacetum cinerariifolium]